MKTLTIFKTLGPIDLKNVRRDSLLLWLPLVPIIQALVIRSGVPIVAAALQQNLGFDLTHYYPLIMGAFVLESPITTGMIVGFLLLDERDSHMLTALLVTPMPLSGYFLYRISIPVLLGVTTTLIGFPIAGLTPLPFGHLLVVALLGSLIGPQVALFLAAFAENKVAGFAMFKFLNSLLFIPIVAFFLPGNWQLLAPESLLAGRAWTELLALPACRFVRQSHHAHAAFAAFSESSASLAQSCLWCCGCGSPGCHTRNTTNNIDFSGPYEVFGRLPGARLPFIIKPLYSFPRGNAPHSGRVRLLNLLWSA